MSLIKETHKAIHDECVEAQQIEFKNTLVKFMEELIKENNLSDTEKFKWAESLLNSYKKESQLNED